MTVHVDLSADLHGHVADFAASEDRRWFQDHPGARSYDRPALEHELCDPRRAPECVPMVESPEVPSGFTAEAWMTVTRLAPGVRVKALVWIVVRWVA